MCNLVSIQNNLGDEILVADIKRNCILNIISSASLCKQIDTIVLFGSALETRCTNNSDIDLAIISKSNLYKLVGYKKFLYNLYDFDESQEYDRLCFKSMEELQRYKDLAVYDEILNKGKIIYSRGVV